jgi:hypothetical protein
MMNGLAIAGLLKGAELEAATAEITRKMLSLVEDTISRTCIPSNPSLGAHALFCALDVPPVRHIYVILIADQPWMQTIKQGV